MGQFDGIFSATANTDLSKNQFGSIFNDQSDFRKRQEEDRIRIEKQRQEEAQVKQQQEQRNSRPLSKKIKEAAPEFIKGAELGALQLFTTGARTLSRAANDLGISQNVVNRLDMYAKKDRESLTILQEEYAKNDPKTKKLANLNYLIRGLGQTLTTMVPAIGASAAAAILAVPAAVGATVGAVAMAPLIFGEAWDQSKQAGKTDEEADLRAALTTVVLGALERIGLGKILKPSMAPTLVKRIIGKMGESITTEVLTENIQNFADVAIGKSFGENKSFKDALQSIPETSVQTVLATIAFSGVVGVTQRTQGPNGMVLEEEKTELPFDPEAADIAPVIEETRKVVEQALQSIPEVEDTPEATTEAQNATPSKGMTEDEFMKGQATLPLDRFTGTTGVSMKPTDNIFNGNELESPRGFGYTGDTIANKVAQIKAGERLTVTVGMNGDQIVVVDGNHTLAAYKQLGVKDVPIVDKTNGKLGVQTTDQLRAEFRAQNVKTTPDILKLQSRVYERLQQEHPEILTEDLTYTKNNMKADAIKAVALISKDKQKAYRVATGMEEAPKGQTATAVSIALGEKALSEGNTELYRKLTINRSLEQTRRGQEIVAEKGSVTDNSVARYVKELISTRLDKLGDSYLSDITEKITKKTTKQKATDILDREAKKIEAKIKSKKLDLKTALDLLNNHICV